MMSVLVNKGVVKEKQTVLLNTNVGPGRFHSYQSVWNISQDRQRCTVRCRNTVQTVQTVNSYCIFFFLPFTVLIRSSKIVLQVKVSRFPHKLLSSLWTQFSTWGEEIYWRLYHMAYNAWEWKQPILQEVYGKNKIQSSAIIIKFKWST